MTIELHNSDAAVTAVRSAVRDYGTWAKFVADNAVTRENFGEYALSLAALAFPKAEPVQKKDGKRTIFGNAVQAAKAGMTRAMEKEEGDETAKNLLTREGKSATREAVIAEWEAAQS